MDIKKELEKSKISIDNEIEIYINRVIKEARDTDPFILDAIKFFKKQFLQEVKELDL